MRIDELGAHLEAYARTLPTITTLRLCNRFGTGDDCHISRLPVELVKLIEDHIIEPERKDALEIWSQTLKCGEGRCEPFKHYGDEDLYRFYHSTYGCLNDGCKTDHPQINNLDECYHYECVGDKCPAWRYDRDSNSKIRKSLKELPDAQLLQSHEYLGVDDRCDVWRIEFADLLDEDGTFFTKKRELLKTHFGLSVWTAKLRPPSMSEDHHTITVYLTLPNDVSRHEKWQSEDYRAEDIGYGMPMTIGAQPTEHSLSRFPRALNILGLQAWSHPSLEGRLILSPPSIDTLESKANDKAAIEPQVTFLVRNKSDRIW